MDKLSKESDVIDMDNPAVLLHSSMTETGKNEDVIQNSRRNNEPPAKSVSCTELLTNYLKSSSCSNMDGKTLFYNEKGWPVKILKLTEDSPPKTTKPRSTRSVPSTSNKKSPRKEKSIYTQKTQVTAQSRLRKKSESLKEDKENKKTEPSEENGTECSSKINFEQPDPKEIVDKKIDDGVGTDLKSMLQKLDETMDQLTSDKPAQVTATTNRSTTSNKSVGSSQRNSSLERKKTQNDVKKDDVLHSARSNKYNSKDVKAYMQAKRVERKIQMSEETRRKQNMLEMQKKNLEKLREKALQVLKKSSAKSTDETKPKWQGPLEEEDSEVLPPAIHIFENKIPTARKPKTNLKVDEANVEKESSGEKPLVEHEKYYNKSEELEKILNEDNEIERMDSKKPNLGLDNTRRKLRLSKSKPCIENHPMNIGMEAAAMEIVPLLQLEMENARRSLESNIQSPKLSRDGNYYNVALETNETANGPHSSRRTTFTCTPRESVEADLPRLEESFLYEAPTKLSAHSDTSNTSSHRKRHHFSPAKTNNTLSKKLCGNTQEEVLNNKVSNSFEDQLRRIQEVLQKQKENNEPDKLLSQIKPDGFSIMNVMKMKLLTNENKYLPKTNPKEKIITTKNSFDDDTDAPSIISMEEDFRPHVEPLRLSDLQLKLDRSDQTSLTSQLSSATSKTSGRNAVESLKSSSYTYDAPPLLVPESVQNLKLSSSRSYNELSNPSQKISSHSSIMNTKISSHATSSNLFPGKQEISNSLSSVSKSSQGHPRVKTFQESIHSDVLPTIAKDAQAVQRSNPAALFLQFHAELSRLDAFDQSLAQVIAAERLHSLSAHVHVCNRPTRTMSDVGYSHVATDRPERTSRSRSSQYSSIFEQHSTEPKASPISDVGSVRTVTSHQDPPAGSRSASSAHSVVEQLSPVLDNTQSDVKEVPQKFSPFLNSSSSSIPLPFSPKSIHILKVLIDDAMFQKKQVELMYKTQEDILLAQYKAELSEIDMRYRRDGQLTNIGIETKKIVEEKYQTPLIKLRQTRDEALSNSDARIEYLTKQISWLKKQKKSKGNPRSAETSPKKLTPLRSISLTSVVENSSSSESSVGLATFDDKKRQETERSKSSSVSSRRKIDREMLWRLQEELARVKELQKGERSQKSSRSRRDKSTSPLESVQETSTKDVACSVNGDAENISPQATSSSVRTVEEARSTDVYNSESFESPESSETPRQPKMIAKIPLSSKPFVTARPNNKNKVLIKVPLSPRVQVRARRRGSSGSDESLLLSQNETQSEQSDYEVRISALKEQKRQRFAELNRLERELKRAQREQLKATEAALVKQIQAYELKITQTKKQLDEVTATNIVRPQIKHPRVSDKFFPRTSDVFQKSQIIEELPKQQEQNVSDLDTNSLKSISEASSTETAIQSSGVVPVTEPSSKSSVEADNETKEVLSVESEVREALSSVASETDVPTVLDTQKSCVSETQELNEFGVEPVVLESTNKDNPINWMDAEDYFNQMDSSGNVPSDESKHARISSEKSASSISPETNISEELSNEPLDKSKSNTSSQEFHDAEEILGTPKTESIVNSSSKQSDTDNSEKVSEEPSQTESPVKEETINFDEGRVTSVVSESPSNKSQHSVPESVNTDLQSTSHHSNFSKPESDVSQYDDDDVNISNIVSEKSDITETSHSLLASVGTASQCQSADEENVQSDEEATSNTSQSEVIKMFVSNKTQESKEQIDSDNNNVNLNETFIVSESETKPDKDDSVVDNITDKILQNLLNECLVCRKDDESIEVERNILESDESSERTSDVQLKTQVVVNNFTQTVLNKFVQEATDCMLKIKDAKKAAEVKRKDNELVNGEVSSNKLLEALALERKVSPSEKVREETTAPSKPTQGSNNEVELTAGNESEVWFEEELPAVSLQTQREAEELRLKQLQIEQEIEQIKQLEAQESIPYYYLREIPNKPPPPYTPPGQSVARETRLVPTRREDIEKLVSTATKELVTVWQAADDLSAAEPTEEYRSLKIGNKIYNKFLFDLVKQIFVKITSTGVDEKELPPWERTGCEMKHFVLPKFTEESISDFVMKKVQVLFGFEPDSIKESGIIEWSRKKRDRVDELLVRESQEEERDWTDYSKCAVAVKNNVALGILDSLLEETGQVLSEALHKKLAYCQKST
ncbi:centrosome-associated protein 350-like [Macrosteles quadrilineatus]|uniref:centrosome-associated protein 350-like n=1 Tax=Macrosteles quadrilineatus TaxID=74068 RepID=UPI0023E2994C|nr:centrosome-associated protein 350-like [Macrosteles quadrilineatus]